MAFKTDQEEFWAGEFGDSYIQRNEGDELLASNINFFSKALKQVGRPSSLIEFGANIGMNLKAIKLLYPGIKLHGIEINQKAAGILEDTIGKENVSNQSILDFSNPDTSEVTLIKGVLIHIHPDMLKTVYHKLYNSSSKYILVCEYYNPTPVTINYRGNSDKLFKRDFAGEMLQEFPNLKLLDYGFVYKNDSAFPQDDITWFLLSKN